MTLPSTPNSPAAAPIRYRALTEVARLSPTETAQVSNLPFTHAPALLLALQQGTDGTWEGGMLALPSSKAHRFEGRTRLDTNMAASGS